MTDMWHLKVSKKPLNIILVRGGNDEICYSDVTISLTFYDCSILHLSQKSLTACS
jgi:hypothetical protein